MEIINRLIAEGCSVQGYDPVASVEALEGFSQSETAIDAASGSDALLFLTEWSEFKDLEPESFLRIMQGSIVLDTRRVLKADLWKKTFEVFEVIGE
jgi:UDPglucose 6-dehydrogenase